MKLKRHESREHNKRNTTTTARFIRPPQTGGSPTRMRLRACIQHMRHDSRHQGVPGCNLLSNGALVETEKIFWPATPERGHHGSARQAIAIWYKQSRLLHRWSVRAAFSLRRESFTGGHDPVLTAQGHEGWLTYFSFPSHTPSYNSSGRLIPWTKSCPHIGE